MKKILIIPILIISILSFNNVKAAGISASSYINNYYDSSGNVLPGSNLIGDGQQLYPITQGGNNIYLNSNHNWSNGLSIPANQYKEIIFLVGFRWQTTEQQENVSLGIMAKYVRNNNLYATTICTFSEDIDAYYDYIESHINSTPKMLYGVIHCPLPVYSSEIKLARLDFYAGRDANYEQLHINRNVNLIYNDNYILQEQQQETTNAINSQTQQQQQQFNNFMNETQQYNQQIDTNQTGANETIEYMQKEEQLMNSLDLNTTMLDNLSINSQASAFIWDIAEGLRSMNPAIITLFTTMLGLGIAKLILNR